MSGTMQGSASPFIFVSERGSMFTTAGFARMIERTAASAGLELKAHPHMLRHACSASRNPIHTRSPIPGTRPVEWAFDDRVIA